MEEADLGMSSSAGGRDLAQRLGALPASGSCEPGASGLPAPRSLLSGLLLFP